MSLSNYKVMAAVIDRRTGLPMRLLGEVQNPDALFTVPPDETMLWRYSDYRWIRSLIVDRTLYFRRADRFKDQLEGRFTEGNRQRPSAMFAEVARNLPTDTVLPIQESHRSHVYLNCWHKNPEENERMWREYTTVPDSIAVKTDLASLLRSLPDQIRAANVHYVEEQDSIPEFHSLAVLVHKRREPHAFENELRLIHERPLSEIVPLDTKEDEGRLVPLISREIIKLIRLHPRAPAEFREAVRRDMAAVGLAVPLEESAFRQR